MHGADETYDYVIVGGGSAGCVLANRLSAGPATRVLLLEAGGRDDYLWIRVPVGYLYCMGIPRTEAEPRLGDRVLNYPRAGVRRRARPLPRLHRGSVCNLRPESRGSVTLAGADAHVPPAIRPNYPSAEADVRVAVEAVRTTRAIVARPALARYRRVPPRPGFRDRRRAGRRGGADRGEGRAMILAAAWR